MKKFNQLDYINGWQKDHVKRINIALNLNTDSDIINKLESVPSKNGYIKDLIRKDINNDRKRNTSINRINRKKSN